MSTRRGRLIHLCRKLRQDYLPTDASRAGLYLLVLIAYDICLYDPGTLHSVSDGQNACGLNIDSLQRLSGQGFWLLILQKRTLNPVVISVIGVVVEAPN